MRWSLALALTLAAAGEPGDTKTVEVKGREGFLKFYDTERVTIDARGKLRMGYASKSQGVGEEGAVWCGLERGRTTWLGTTSGKIYVSTDQGEPKLEFDTGELVVTSIVELRGELYASTIPSGKIFKHVGNGGWKEHLTLESRYVWDLVESKQQIVAVCGMPAALVRVSGQGSPQTIYRFKGDHLLCALPEGDGFWVGTANPGHLIDTRTGRVHQDFPGAEVRSIVKSGADLWLAVNASKATPGELIKTAQAQGVAEPVAAAGANRPPIAADLWKISDARADDLVMFPGTVITGLIADAEGVLVATNSGGRLFRVLPDGSFEMRDDLKSGQICGFFRNEKGVIGALLGNRGRVAWFGASPAAQGTYTSAVHDSGFVSNWGQLEVRGAGKFAARVRSGMVQRPDEGWSNWSEALSTFPVKMVLPKGRYFQFQIALQDPAAQVSEVRFSYRNENQAPRLSNLKIESLMAMPPMDMPLPGSDPGQHPPPIHSPLKQVSWQSVDPDGDDLVYTLQYRAQNAKSWLPVAEGQSILGPSIRWNTDSIPDGTYILKVIASDERGNPGNEKLTAELESPPIVIDNGKPAVKVQAGGGKLTGRAVDTTSRIVKLEYQIDGGDWRSFPCKDGVFDSLAEEFEIALPATRPGAHTVTVRAIDEELNAGLAAAEFKTE